MMKHHQTCLSILLACSLVGSVLGGAGGCTPSTCPPGPVSVEFTSSDCTGTPTFFAVDEVAGVCDDGRQMLADEEGLTFFRFDEYNGLDCNHERANSSYRIDIYTFGQCVRNDGRRGAKDSSVGRASLANSFMFLANVNDTITPYTFDNQWIQSYESSYTSCYSLGNCTTPDGSTPLGYEDYYSNVGCVNPQYSYFFDEQAWDTCLNYYNATYVKFGCFDEHGSYFAQFNDAECKIPAVVYGSRSVCETSQRTYHCNAPITQFPRTPTAPQVPTSTASSSTQSSILILAVGLLVLTIF
jgi:hypothetical protein